MNNKYVRNNTDIVILSFCIKKRNKAYRFQALFLFFFHILSGKTVSHLLSFYDCSVRYGIGYPQIASYD